MRDLANRANKLPKPKVKGVSVNLPFLSIDVEFDDSETRIAREVLLRLNDKRVLVASECCDSCIRNSLTSIQEIRKLLVDKQVELTDDNGPLFLLFDLMLIGIRQFMTYTEGFDGIRDRQEYFAALQVLREHLHRCISAIGRVSGIEPKFINQMSYDPNWSGKVYLKN